MRLEKGVGECDLWTNWNYRLETIINLGKIGFFKPKPSPTRIYVSLSNLAARNRESPIARFPESQARNRQNSATRSTKLIGIAVKWNRGKSIQNRHPNRILLTLKVTLESHDAESPDSRCRIADSAPLARLCTSRL